MSLAQCFRCISQINILSPGNPSPHRTWNQAHRNFSKELHGSRPHLHPSSSQPHGWLDLDDILVRWRAYLSPFKGGSLLGTHEVTLIL